jgi:hypothetical protein
MGARRLTATIDQGGRGTKMNSMISEVSPRRIDVDVVVVTGEARVIFNKDDDFDG